MPKIDKVLFNILAGGLGGVSAAKLGELCRARKGRQIGGLLILASILVQQAQVDERGHDDEGADAQGRKQQHGAALTARPGAAWRSVDHVIHRATTALATNRSGMNDNMPRPGTPMLGSSRTSLP